MTRKEEEAKEADGEREGKLDRAIKRVAVGGNTFIGESLNTFPIIIIVIQVIFLENSIVFHIRMIQIDILNRVLLR